MRLRENIELEYFPAAMAAKMCDYLTFLQIFISFKVVYFGLEQQKEKELNSLVISFYPIYNINIVIFYFQFSMLISLPSAGFLYLCRISCNQTLEDSS